MRSWRTLLYVAVTAAAVTAAGSASAATCATASVAAYTTPGFSCSVGPVEFSNISVNTIVNGLGASAILGNFTPFTTGNDFGLSLNFSAFTGTAPNATTDVAWTYNVSALPGFLLNDVYMALSGNSSGTGGIVVNETLSNGVTLSLNGPGATSANFTPVASLFAIKDQFNFSGAGPGFATTSILQNAYSVVPGPIAGAGLPALLALGGFVWARRRKAAATA